MNRERHRQLQPQTASPAHLRSDPTKYNINNVEKADDICYYEKKVLNLHRIIKKTLMDLTISMNTVLNFLHSMALSTSNKRWLADHLYEEVRAEEKAMPVIKAKRKLTETEKDELFEKMVGSWKDDPIGDKVLEAIRIGRQPASYERKLAYFDDDE